MNELPFVIHACFILHNCCEERKESISQQNVDAALKCDKEFQPPVDSNIRINNNEGGGKAVRQIYVKYFNETVS